MTVGPRTRSALARGACVGGFTALVALALYLDLRQAALLGLVSGLAALGLRLGDTGDR